MKREHGQGPAEQVEKGLGLLKRCDNQRACYWICPFCMTKDCAPRHFPTAKEFLTHVDTCHEGVQTNEEGEPCMCSACEAEVSTRVSLQQLLRRQ